MYFPTILFTITSFYFMIVGLWRMASSVVPISSGTALNSIDYEEEHYNPVSDLTSIKEILVWAGSLIKNFTQDDFQEEAIIVHRQLAWGVFWFFLGIGVFCLQKILFT